VNDSLKQRVEVSDLVLAKVKASPLVSQALSDMRSGCLVKYWEKKKQDRHEKSMKVEQRNKQEIWENSI
jgi:hypothetical protein